MSEGMIINWMTSDMDLIVLLTTEEGRLVILIHGGERKIEG